MQQFYYYNINPDGKVEEDCVTRAISIASGIPYKAVAKLLTITADENGCDMLCMYCYRALLEDTLGYTAISTKTYKTVGDIAEEYKNNIVIVRIDGHLTACMYGVCVDIWDCTREEVDCFWIVQ